MWEKRHFIVLPSFAAIILTSLFITGCLSIWFLNKIPNIYVTLSNNAANPKYLLIISNNNSKNTQTYVNNKLSTDDESTLIDITNFKFTINHNSCNETKPFLLILIHSAPANLRKRNVIRETWGQHMFSITTLFLVGFSEKYNTKLKEEDTQYKDLIQGNFLDTYRNMTYKHVMALKWVTYYCPNARYVLKLDDDVYVHVTALLAFLKKYAWSNRLIMCNTILTSSVKRSWRSKWRVSPLEYPDTKYPAYCPGWAILYSSDATFLLYGEAQRTPFFWIDDVHITGTLAKRINLTQISIGSMILNNHKMTLFLQKSNIYRVFLFGPPDLKENTIRALHSAVTTNAII